MVGVPELRVEAENNTSELQTHFVTPFLLAISIRCPRGRLRLGDLNALSLASNIAMLPGTGVSLSNHSPFIRKLHTDFR